MTRKKKQDNPLVLVIYWLLGLLLILFASLATLIIFLGWLVCEMRYSRYPRTLEETGILMDHEERQDLAESDSHIRSIEARLAQIRVDGQHLRRRKDGMFHAASSLGVQLNSETNNLLIDLSDSQAMRHELLSRPDQRLRSWAAILSRLIAFRWAAMVYLVCIAYSLIVTPASVDYMNQMILNWLDSYFPIAGLPIYGGMALASIVASCAGGMAYLFYSRLIHGHYSHQLQQTRDLN